MVAIPDQMLITLAGMRFVALDLKEIMIGAVATDVHADGRKPFVAAVDSLMSLQEGAVRVTARDRDRFRRSVEGERFSAVVARRHVFVSRRRLSLRSVPGLRKAPDDAGGAAVFSRGVIARRGWSGDEVSGTSRLDAGPDWAASCPYGDNDPYL